MYWIELKNALLYGRPQISQEMMQPQSAKIAVKEIARLVSFGWIDELTEEMLERIRPACDVGQCPEILDELQKFKRQTSRRNRKRTSKTMSMQHV